MNPLVLVGVICLSLLLCLAQVIFDSDSQTAAGQSAKNQARVEIERNFFSDDDSDDNSAALKPYQEYLREAQRAYTRKDRKTERRMYMNVLQLLREEGRDAPGMSLTGGASLDKDLEKQLTILLSGN